MSLLQIKQDSDSEYNSDDDTPERFLSRNPIGDKTLFDKYGLIQRPYGMETMKPNNLTIKLPARPPLGQTQQMYRTGFKRVPIKARGTVGNIDDIIALDEKYNGKRVQFSDKAVRNMFEVRVPDPKDTTYKQQGRLQRTIMKRVSFDVISKKLNDQLATIAHAVVQGRTESATDRAKMIAQLGGVFSSPKKVAKMSEDDIASVAKASKAVAIPRDAITKRFWTRKEFTNDPLIAPYLMSKAMGDIVAYHYTHIKGKPPNKDAKNYSKEPLDIKMFYDRWKHKTNQTNIFDVETVTLIPSWLVETITGVGAKKGPLDFDSDSEEKADSGPDAGLDDSVYGDDAVDF